MLPGSRQVAFSGAFDVHFDFVPNVNIRRLDRCVLHKLFGSCSDKYDSGIYLGAHEDGMREHFMYNCRQDETFTEEHFLPVVIFVLFIFLSGLVMLSLFVGAVTMAMTESMESMKEEAEEKEKRKRKLKAMKKASQQMESKPKRKLSIPRPRLMRSNTAPVDGFKAEKVLPRQDSLSKEEQKSLNKMRAVLLHVWDGVDLTNLLDDDDIDDFEGGPIAKMFMRVSLASKSISDSPFFNNFITFVIIIAGMMVGMQTFKTFDAKYQIVLVDGNLLKLWWVTLTGSACQLS